MKYNELQVSPNKDRKRVGRGTKGQNSRTGKKLRPMFQGGQRPLAQAVPKKRGFKSLKMPAQVVYLDHLNAFAGKMVDNAVLFEEGYISTPFHSVKVISRGELSVKVDLKVQAASKSAIEAIQKAGGTFEKVATPIRESQKTAEKDAK